MNLKLSELQAVSDQLGALKDASLFSEGSEEYKESVESYFTLQNSTRKPAYIFRPKNTDSLAKAISILAEADVVFSIRSGGHFTTAGGSNQDGGITIDLRAFNSIEVLEGKTRVKLGTGATWGQVSQTLDAQDLAVAGGRESAVGVGGLTLGGGFSYFSGLVGLTCDNVEDYEVVLASGKVVHATEKENPDLFRALRGGANNFGVVTYFTVRCFTRKDIWVGEVVQPITTIEEQMQAFYEYANRPDTHPGGSVIHSLLKGGAMSDIVVTATVHTDASDEEPKDFEAFQKIQPTLMHRFKKMNLTDFTLERDKWTPKGFGNIFIGTTSRLSLELIRNTVAIWEKSYEPVKDIQGLRWVWTFQVVSPAVIAKSPFLQEVLKSTKSASSRESNFEPIIIHQLAGTWERQEDSQQAEDAARKLVKDVDAEIDRLDLNPGYRYLNYSHPSQDVFSDGSADGGQRKKWLQEISKKYDPNGMFQRKVPGGHKLF